MAPTSLISQARWDEPWPWLKIVFMLAAAYIIWRFWRHGEGLD
jgi:hypothetical protein